jgi:hypothetical protein
MSNEMGKCYIYHQFKFPSFINYELNLLEIVKGEYFNFKKRLSIDLLSSQMMNNDLSDKDQCFMSCVKIDDAINVIFFNYETTSWLCEFDNLQHYLIKITTFGIFYMWKMTSLQQMSCIWLSRQCFKKKSKYYYSGKMLEKRI